MKENLDFGQAIGALKKGKRAARESWSSKGMFIFMRPADQIRVDIVADDIKSLPDSVKNYYKQDCYDEKGNLLAVDDDDVVKFTAYLCLKSDDGQIFNGWSPSQSDIFAEDWMILD